MKLLQSIIMTDQILARMVVLATALLVVGIALCIPLFEYNYRKFLSSTIFVKSLMWVPIFVIFVVFISWPGIGALIIWLSAALMVIVEIGRFSLGKYFKLRMVYVLVLCTAFAHLLFISQNSSDNIFFSGMIALLYGSVLSDVAAYFAGNYLGRHPLPESLNPNKRWEGVIGQILGAVAGVLLVDILVIDLPNLWIALPIGLASAVGDLANSYVKRKLDIKNWSRALPGHGGFADRLSSLSFASAAVYYFLLYS